MVSHKTGLKRGRIPKICRRMREALRQRQGFTIVSVMVAFVLLMISISMFYGAVVTSQNMMDRARQLDRTAEQAARVFYENDYGQITPAAEEPARMTLRERDGKGSIEVRAERREVELPAADGGETAETEAFSLYYYGK